MTASVPSSEDRTTQGKVLGLIQIWALSRPSAGLTDSWCSESVSWVNPSEWSLTSLPVSPLGRSSWAPRKRVWRQSEPALCSGSCKEDQGTDPSLQAKLITCWLGENGGLCGVHQMSCAFTVTPRARRPLHHIYWELVMYFKIVCLDPRIFNIPFRPNRANRSQTEQSKI